MAGSLLLISFHGLLSLPAMSYKRSVIGAFYPFAPNHWAPGVYLREGPGPFLHDVVAV